MANTTEVILLQVDVVMNTARIAELKKELLENAKALEILNKGLKTGTVSVDTLAMGQTKYGIASKAAQQEIAVLTKANEAQIKVVNANAGSIEQLRAQLALGTAEYNKLGAAERDNTEAGQKLRATNKALSDNLRMLGKAVGEYNAEVRDANAENGRAAEFFSKLNDKAQALPGPLQGVAGGLAETGKGLLTATKAALAFIATPLGLFLTAITAAFYVLKEAFTATDDGQEALAAGLAGLRGVFSVLEGAVISVGKGLITVFTEPKKAAGELIDFLENQVINRVKAYGVIFDALRNGDFKQATNGVLQLATGVENVVGKTQAFTAELSKARVAAESISSVKDKLENAEIKAIALNETARQQAEKLVLSAKDRNLSEEQRLKNLAQADRLEKQVLDRNLLIEETRLAIIQKENAEREKTGTLLDDQRRIEQEQIAKLAQLQGQADAAAQSRENRRSVLQEQAAAARKAELTSRVARAKEAADAAQKRREDAVRAQIVQQEILLLQVQKGSAAELVVRQRLIQLTADLELAAARKTVNERQLIQAKANVAIQQLSEDFNQKQVELAKKATEETIKEREREYAEAKQSLEDYLATKRAAIEQDLARGILSENQAQKQLSAIENASLAAELIIARDFSQKLGAIQKRQADNEIRENRRVAAEKKRIKQAEVDIVEAAAEAGIVASDAVIEAFGKESEAGRAALVVKKTLAIAEIGINLQKQLAANAEAGAKISAEAPPFTVPLGIAYTIATDALAIVAAGAGAAKILGFNTGGIVPGQGSTDTVPAMLTPGEVVMNKTASKEYAPLLSYLNSMTGGVNFAPGFTPSQPAQIDGGLTARAVGNTAPIDYDRLADSMSKVKLDVGVRTIEKGRNDYNKPRRLTSSG